MEGIEGHKVIFFIPLPYSPSFLLSLFPSLPIAKGSGERCKLPQQVWGGAPADNAF